MTWYHRITLIVALLVLMCSIAAAGTITLQTTTMDILLNETGTLNMTIINRGDVPAVDVNVFSYFDEKTYFIGNLGENTIQIPVDMHGKNPGTYSLIWKINYRDTKGYPYSAITNSKIVKQEPTAGNIYLIAADMKMQDNGQLEIIVKNRNTVKKTVSVNLYLSSELISEELKTISTEPNGQDSVIFNVVNNGANENSAYYYIASADYDETGKHYSVISSGTIIIEKQANVIWFGVIAVFAAIVVIAYFIMRKKK